MTPGRDSRPRDGGRCRATHVGVIENLYEKGHVTFRRGFTIPVHTVCGRSASAV